MSDEISVQVDEGQIKRLLEKFDRARMLRIIEEGMSRGMTLIHGGLPPYPPPPASSTYRRTGTLGREITTDTAIEGNAVVGKIGTVTEYASYVISRDDQAWMHEGRWWTLDEEVEKAVDQVGEEISAHIEKMLE